MTIEDLRRDLAGAPVRLCFRGDPYAAARRGTILFYHGLGSCIADQSNELLSLAAHGFLAVGVDNVGHGERYWPNQEELLARHDAGEHDAFLPAIQESVDEVPKLVDALEASGLAYRGRIGLGGMSMGGFIAFGAAVAEPRLSAVTPILGTPYWGDGASRSPHRRAAGFFPVALLVQNSGQDQSVPAGDARALCEELVPLYRSKPDRLAYVEFPDEDHVLGGPAWEQLWGNVLTWYQRFLVPGVRPSGPS